MNIVTETKEVITRKCSIHGDILNTNEETCPRCDKCEHGVSRYGDCAKCNNYDWMTLPVTEEEFKRVWRSISWGAGPWRNSPYPRQYRVVGLTRMVLAEYAKLKGWEVPR